MKIGILYICTGRYSIFWKTFYESCEKYLIPEYEKHYFVFTDSPKISYEEKNKKINRFYQNDLGWPFNTLKRFEIFLTQKEKLKKMDYLFFFNANMEIIKKISKEEFLPSSNEKLVVSMDISNYDKSLNFPFEQNKNSLAFVPKNENNFYVRGSLNGGKTKDYIDMLETIKNNVLIDLEKNIIAIWHDESHLNKYVQNLDCMKKLTPSYDYPEGKKYPFEPKIIRRDKRKWGGNGFLRNENNFKTYMNYIGNKLKFLFK